MQTQMFKAGSVGARAAGTPLLFRGGVSRGRAALAGALLAWLIVFPPPLPAVADDRNAVRPAPAAEAEITPDATVQATIARFAAAPDPAQRQAALHELTALPPPRHAELVRQLVWSASRAADTPHALAPAVILRRLDLPDFLIAQALAPVLDSADAALVKSVRGLLEGLEQRAPGRRPNFAVYLELLAGPVRAQESLPTGLVRYLYEVDAGEALLLLMRAHQLRQPEELRAILWAEHVVTEVLWKQQHGFLPPAGTDPAAMRELARLAGHDAWWARLYVAEMMRQHPEFAQPEVLAKLQQDANPLVRAAAGRPRPGK